MRDNRSSYSRESQFSFYAADSGIECAMYWDMKENAFATSTATNPQTQNIQCGNTSIIPNIISEDGSDATLTFNVPLNDASNNGTPQPYCAIVTIEKTDPSGSGSSATTIDSRGYNVCDSSGTPVYGNPNLVERALEVSYQQ